VAKRARCRLCGLLVAVAAASVPVAGARAADHVKIGTLLTTGNAPLYLAIEKGYFAAAGIEPELVPFDAGQPVAVATVSGAIDFGAAGVTSALYTLAGEGSVKIVAGTDYDRPHFPAGSIVASNAAYAGGLKSPKDLAGHSVALTQVGSTFNYALAIVAEKYRVDMASLRTQPLQSFANVASAVSGGRTDAAVLLSAMTLPLVAHGDVKLVAWIGDEVPWQVAAIWISTKTANERHDLVRRYLDAMRKGAHDADAAFVGPGQTRADGPTAPAVIAVIQKYVHLSAAQVDATVGYDDPELRIDEKDVQRQLDWYHAQGMLKTAVTLDQVLDRRYVVPLPGS
jgi:NitT/TauT family transport system substrate-binding protein